MIQNIGGFLTLAWLWSQREKDAIQPEVVIDSEVPVEEVVSYVWDLDEIPEHCQGLTPGSPAYIACVTEGRLIELEPTNGQPVCPPLEKRMDLTVDDTLNWDPSVLPCGCPPGYRKVEVRRGKYSTATRCYSGT